MRFNTNVLPNGDVIILNEIKDIEETDCTTIEIDNQELLEKLKNTKIQYTINPETLEIVKKRVKSVGFENFPEGGIKEKIMQSLKEYFTKRLDPWTNIDLAIYMNSMLVLADKGFVITEENREEKYLEILETGDETNINLLEEYLICRDNINHFIQYKKVYNETKEKLLDLDDDDEELQVILEKLK